MIRYFLLKLLNLTNRTDRLWGGGGGVQKKTLVLVPSVVEQEQ